MWVTDDEFLVFACVKYEDIFHYYLSIHPSYQLISFAICAFSLFVRCYSEVPDAATLVETRPLHYDSALSIRERREKKFWFIQRMQHYEKRCNLHVCRFFRCVYYHLFTFKNQSCSFFLNLELDTTPRKLGKLTL